MNDDHFNYKMQILKKTIGFHYTPQHYSRCFCFEIVKNVGIHHYHTLYHFQLELKMIVVFFDYIYSDLIT
jgi:hypothetical protein